MRNFNLNTINNDTWLTPPEIIKKSGPFDLDPCSPINRPWDTAKEHFTIEHDGLSQFWFGRVWLNPPYGKETFKWLEKLWQHRSGIALIFARTETKAFFRYVWDGANAVFFMKGRINFYDIKGNQASSANAPSCLISYSDLDTQIIKDSNIKGKLIDLKKDVHHVAT